MRSKTVVLLAGCLATLCGAMHADAREDVRVFVSVAEGDGFAWREGSPAGPPAQAVLGRFQTISGADSYAVIPYKAGLLVRAVQDKPFSFSTADCGGGTYCGNGRYNMAMLGIRRRGQCLLVSWDTPDVNVRLEGDGKALHAAVTPLAEGVHLQVRELGEGDYVTIAKAYRALRAAEGALGDDESRARVRRLDGAIAIKPCAKTGVAPDADPVRFPSGRGQTHVGFTFEQISRIASHLRRDLGIRHALVTVSGWMHGGYDVGHPDILPAAEDCGGDEGLRRCSDRVRAIGYLFGLHDNYDMLYASAPSTDPADAVRPPGADGPVFFNAWAGGPQYSCCPLRQEKYLTRNLESIARLFRPDSYFVDQWTALPLYRCAAPGHPLTRSECIDAYRRLTDVVHRKVDVLGSEDGQEWAVGYIDYFEGILTRYPVEWGEYIPLFELVYREAAAAFPHQGDKVSVGKPESALQLLLCGRTPIIDLPEGVYFEGRRARTGRRNPLGFGAVFEAEQAPAAGVARPAILAHPPWRGVSGRTVGTYRVKLPDVDLLQLDFYVGLKDGAAGGGVNFMIRVDGEPIFSEYWDEQAWGHHVLDLSKYAGREVSIDLVTDPGESTAFDWALWGEPRILAGGREVYSFVKGVGQAEKAWEMPDDPFARADGGWAEGLMPLDALFKNCAAVLGELNLLTASVEMTGHRFLTDDHTVQRTSFADGTVVTANFGAREYTAGDTVLPQYGFLVSSPTMLAFYATRFGGIAYPDGALFVVTALDGKPIARSDKLHIYHGFGSPARIRIPRRGLSKGWFETGVRRERTITPPSRDVKVWTTEWK